MPAVSVVAPLRNLMARPASGGSMSCDCSAIDHEYVYGATPPDSVTCRVP